MSRCTVIDVPYSYSMFICTCLLYILCKRTYKSLLLQVGQVPQCIQVSPVSVVPPVELNTVQTVHLHTAHGALQRLLHHLRTETHLSPTCLLSTVSLTVLFKTITTWNPSGFRSERSRSLYTYTNVNILYSVRQYQISVGHGDTVPTPQTYFYSAISCYLSDNMCTDTNKTAVS